MDKVVRYTKFPDNPHGDGGARRSAQIKEYWLGKNVEFIDEKFKLPKQYSFFTAVGWLRRSFWFVTRNIGWRQYSSWKEKYKALKVFALLFPVCYDRYKNQNVTFIWEDTFDYFSMYLMKAAGAKIIAYPHNLESLVPHQSDQLTRKQSPYWLYEEVERFKMCDEVNCISKEETWLLQLYGVNAHYYPYYPPKEVEKELQTIKGKRERRESNEKHYLLLGSATNCPTCKGMQQLLEVFSSIQQLPYTIHVAGYGTDIFGKYNNDKIIVHGAVSNEQLEELLIQTDGLLINQPTTSGALTRIAECRVAGIPIYANFGAARDYYNLPDVHVYANMEELKEILAN